MLEIEEYIIDYIKENLIIMDLLCSDANDDRIYQWEPAYEINYSKEKKSALFYRNSQIPLSPESTFAKQKGDIYFYFQVVAIHKDLATQISENLINYLAPNINQGFITDNYRVGFISLNGYSDGPNEGTPKFPLYSKNISFKLSLVFSRP